MSELLRSVSAEELRVAGPARLPADVLQAAAAIVEEVRDEPERAVRHHAERLGDLKSGDPLVIGQDELLAAAERIDNSDREVLIRTAARIETFATHQLASLRALETPVPGGFAGHDLAAVDAAGCYAPGGRYPLPSSVLMTAVTARSAGVQRVWVASPRPTPMTLAAAAIAGADGLLACGGAQGIAGLAFGVDAVPACDVIVGPGNVWVTAAKKHLAGEIGIDMLAGPSELLVLADDTADPGMIAADLLAQAEHDPDARPILITTSAELAAAVRGEVTEQLEALPTRAVAEQSMRDHGRACVVADLDAAIALSDRMAPEHLQVMTRDARAVGRRLRHYGGLFLGSRSAEVFGDYGFGPNHVLPTGGAARITGGLSVFTFLRTRTWLHLDTVDPEARADAVRLAELEGLAGHAAAARRRSVDPTRDEP